MKGSKYAKLTGVIFRVLNARDADRVVYLLNSQGEKVVLMAKGLRKPTSRKAHAIDLLNLIEVKTATGGGMGVVSDVKLLGSHSQFKTDLQSLTWVSLICEIVDVFAQEGVEEPGLYRNLANLLEVSKPQNLIQLAAALLLRYLSLAGHIPQLADDVEDGVDLESTDRYLGTTPGYTKQTSLTSDRPGATSLEAGYDLTPIPSRLWKSQLFILQSDFAGIARLSLREPEQFELMRIHLLWLNQSVGRDLRSWKAIQQVWAQKIGPLQSLYTLRY